MDGISIRLRLALWYAGVLLLGMLLFGFAMSVALEHRLLRGVDERLSARLEGARTVFEVEGPGADRERLRIELQEFLKETQDGIEVEIRDAGGGVFASTLEPARRRELRTLARKIVYNGRHYEATAAVALDDVRRVMQTFRDLLLMMIPAMLAMASLGGYWISRRALAPVDDITQVAKSISVHNLSKRLAVPRTGDELQRMSEVWNEVLERLDGAVKRIHEFTADASHELRTPVALIRATAELALRRERTTDEYRSALTDIASEAERMTELTEALLLLARADSGGMELPLEPVDLNGVVMDVARRGQALAAAKGIEVRVELDGRPAPVEANEPSLRRLLVILVDNAVRHTPEGGTIALSVCGAGVEVRDSGPGIAPEVLPHIFERFYRGDKAHAGNGGAGLGLSIAQAIAHAHGSEIRVESRPGEGARFRFDLRPYS